jgi:hypothetical protein
MLARSVRACAVVLLLSGCGGGGDSVDPGPTTRTVAVTRSGSGSGTIASSPAGLSCGTTCTATFATTAAITLTATPDANSQFVSWSGACSGTSATCTVPAGTSAASAGAQFDLILRALTVTLAGTGSGTVTSAPAGITCGTDCSENIANGTVVTLTAAPNATSTFTGWTGGGCAGTGTCTVTMNAATAVTATFAIITHTLTVTLSGTGSGTVTSTPAGINCGSDCTEAYNAATVVTLTAAANATSTFGGWTGAGCTGTGTCVVTMNQAATVTAQFTTIAARWPDSGTRFCTDGAAAVTCPGGIVGHDGFYAINVPNYAVVGGRVQDPITGLFWERSPSIAGFDHATALTYCSNLVVDGFDDWRLPTYLELVSIADFGRVGPAFTSTAFPGIPSNSSYWTSTERAGNTSQALAMFTNYPVTTLVSKTAATDRIARCVRGATFTGTLVVNGGSVTDNRTGLVWQSGTAPTALTWPNALTYCESLVLDGNSDWRLPSGKELMSIVDPAEATIYISPLFTSRPANAFWSSSALANIPDKGYAIDFSSGLSAGIDTFFTAARSVRCVR